MAALVYGFAVAEGMTRSPMTSDPTLTLDVADCGPVTRARVELRPLTVFVGPSNTGKSWLATLAYALHRYLGTGRGRWFLRYRMGPPLPEGEIDEGLALAAADELAAAVSRSVASGEEADIELAASSKDAVRLHVEEQGKAVGKEVERCFGLDAGSLVRTGSSKGARVLLRHMTDGVAKPVEHELKTRGDGWTFRPTVPHSIRIRSDRELQRLADLLIAEPETETARAFQAWQAVRVLSRDVLPKLHPAFYLPADRTGLMNAHATVVSALIQSATLGGIRRADPVPPLSGVRGDFLEQLVEMASSQPGRFPRARPGREHLRRLGKRIEDGMLGGSVKVGGLPGLSYPHFTYQPRGWKSGLPLANASSMVSELGPVVLYLRHVVSPDDLLIIDEPESHLHPAMQVAFMQHVAAIAGAGVRILLTTHSEWVLEALGNVVGRAGLPDFGTDGESLDPSHVGVWLFEPAGDDRGSTVREIALDADTGLYPSGFDEVASALHNDWAEIAGRRGDAG